MNRAVPITLLLDLLVEAGDLAVGGHDRPPRLRGVHLVLELTRAARLRVQEHAQPVAERDAGVLLRRVALEHLEARAARGDVVVDRDAVQARRYERRAAREVDR